MISLFQGATADHVWQQVAQAFRQSEGVATQNGRGGPTREILHAAISIEDPRQRWAVSRLPALNPALALAEVVWIMTGRRDRAFLEFWSKEYRKYAGDGPELHGAYGHRIRRHLSIDQLNRAFQVLSSNPDSRQVVLQIWDSEVDGLGRLRVRCRTPMGRRSMMTSRATSCRCPRSATASLSGCR